MSENGSHAPTKISLPSGGWAELRTVAEITERHRRPISVALSQLSMEGIETMSKLEPYLTEGAATQLELVKIAELGIRWSEEDLKHFSDANDYCIVAGVKAWSSGAPITIDNVLDLPGPDYDVLRAACAPISAALFVDFTMNKDNVDDVKSPFGPSNESAISSPADSSSLNTSPMPSGETIVSSA